VIAWVQFGSTFAVAGVVGGYPRTPEALCENDTGVFPQVTTRVNRFHTAEVMGSSPVSPTHTNPLFRGSRQPVAVLGDHRKRACRARGWESFDMASATWRMLQRGGHAYLVRYRGPDRRVRRRFEGRARSFVELGSDRVELVSGAIGEAGCAASARLSFSVGDSVGRSRSSLSDH
jgi:hypothetical protein